MHLLSLIEKKRDGDALSEAELNFFVQGVTGDAFPDAQVSALLMAMLLRGLSAQETAELTLAMARSGDQLDLSAIPGVKVDKHSTGGVGDKTTLVAAPIVAACGAPVAKMSGRALGHTGGTVDKLESIPGFCATLDSQRFFAQVQACGIAVTGQSARLAPADKKLYALRDVTGTVPSTPLIAASIMSKKLAAGADAIVLDVKCGAGAFIKGRQGAAELAQTMVSIGEAAHRRTVALLTDMSAPLGYAVGNANEVREALSTLSGGGPADLRELSLALGAEMLSLAGLGSVRRCRVLAAQALDSGAAKAAFERMCRAQGGDLSAFAALPEAACVRELTAPCSGFVWELEAQRVGEAARLLGAGRQTKEDAIDPAAGILLKKKPGDAVAQGEPLALLYTDRPETLPEALQHLADAYILTTTPAKPAPLLLGRVDREGVVWYN